MQLVLQVLIMSPQFLHNIRVNKPDIVKIEKHLPKSISGVVANVIGCLEHGC